MGQALAYCGSRAPDQEYDQLQPLPSSPDELGRPDSLGLSAEDSQAAFFVDIRSTTKNACGLWAWEPALAVVCHDAIFFFKTTVSTGSGCCSTYSVASIKQNYPDSVQPVSFQRYRLAQLELGGTKSRQSAGAFKLIKKKGDAPPTVIRSLDPADASVIRETLGRVLAPHIRDSMRDSTEDTPRDPADFEKLEIGQSTRLLYFIRHAVHLLDEAQEEGRYKLVTSKGKLGEGSFSQLFERIPKPDENKNPDTLTYSMKGITQCPIEIIQRVLVDEDLIRIRGKPHLKSHVKVDTENLDVTYSPQDAVKAGAKEGHEPQVTCTHEIFHIFPLTKREAVSFNVIVEMRDGAVVMTSQTVEHPSFPTSQVPIRIVKDSFIRLRKNPNAPESTLFEVVVKANPRGSIPKWIPKMGIAKGLQFWNEVIPSYMDEKKWQQVYEDEKLKASETTDADPK